MESDQSLMPWLCIKLTLVLFGIVGNVLVCKAMCRRVKKQQHKNINMFIFSLAIADLGVLLVVFPISTVWSFMPDKWPFGRIFCKTVFPFADTFYGSSIWSITAIALDRSWNISSIQRGLNQTFHRPSTRRKACFVVFLVWSSSFLVVALPAHIMNEFVESEDGKTCCHIDWKKHDQFKIGYQLMIIVFSYLLPLVIILLAYGKIWRKVQKSSKFHLSMILREVPSSKRPRDSVIYREYEQTLKQNANVKRILTPLVIVFAITMLPLTFYRVLLVFRLELLNAKLDFKLVFLHVIELFTLANSSVNPVIYSMVSKEFRQELNILDCCNLKQSLERHSIIQNSHSHRCSGSTSMSVGEWPPAETLRETNL